MLSNIYYHFEDGTVLHDDEFGEVDFDYWNIRQWRKLYTKLALYNAKSRYTRVRLEIVPNEPNIVF